MKNDLHRITVSSKFLGSALFAVTAVVPAMAYATPPAPCTVAAVTPAAPTGLLDRIQLLEDNRSIEELKAAYSYTLDVATDDPTNANIEKLIQLFADDICLDYGYFGVFRGKAAAKNFFQSSVPAISAWGFHVASQPILSIASSSATGVWKFVSGGVFKSDYAAGVQALYGTYQDEYVKTPSGWKFKVIRVLFSIPPTGP